MQTPPFDQRETEREREREQMVQRQMAARGIRDEAVLEAMAAVPRHAFVPGDLDEHAYADTPLPIGQSQTISQPYMVAMMAEALQLEPDDRVLEIGTGSGYAAAVLAEIAGDVYTVERYKSLAESAQKALQAQGYDDVHVRHGDGSLGWPEHAPYDGIVVAAGGPSIPEPLKEQLAIGGRLVIPVGPAPRTQKLVRLVRRSEDEYEEENLGHVRFVPLVGEAGWQADQVEQRPGRARRSVWRGRGGGQAATGDTASRPAPAARATRPPTTPELIAREAEPIPAIETADLDGLLDRIGDARVVLLGEASHGTAEFYDMRARITRELIARQGFNVVAVEADWPDAMRINQYVTDTEVQAAAERPFTRFPAWMWANAQVLAFVEWLRRYNDHFDQAEEQVGFYGLDLYSLNTSIDVVLRYLEDVDPETAQVARQRYGCLSPWESDPAAYGAAALTGRYRECEDDVVAMLQDLLDKRLSYAPADGPRYFNAEQNARLVTNAERYYRLMYYGGAQSWNLRDRHMFETLQALLDHHGPQSRAVVWAHNSHLGNAAATEMGARGQFNVGQLSREEWGDDAYLVGFGTHRGTVAAASEWGGVMEIKQVMPSHKRSYERLCHNASQTAEELEAFLLHLREPDEAAVREQLLAERL
ncbi:MAG: protein-L-isoaspartate(D-aspartate) O-methyltransferase, partial [Candidatus Promineifilaceae bacterium]|nr:protein-L-isoaspartate(D-aspartate) O-methyltransferase [Candidatus Promineifilaceae bacterium]